jgi:hypothetical protein
MGKLDNSSDRNLALFFNQVAQYKRVSNNGNDLTDIQW